MSLACPTGTVNPCQPDRARLESSSTLARAAATLARNLVVRSPVAVGRAARVMMPGLMRDAGGDGCAGGGALAVPSLKQAARAGSSICGARPAALQGRLAAASRPGLRESLRRLFRRGFFRGLRLVPSPASRLASSPPASSSPGAALLPRRGRRLHRLLRFRRRLFVSGGLLLRSSSSSRPCGHIRELTLSALALPNSPRTTHLAAFRIDRQIVHPAGRRIAGSGKIANHQQLQIESICRSEHPSPTPAFRADHHCTRCDSGMVVEHVACGRTRVPACPRRRWCQARWCSARP